MVERNVRVPSLVFLERVSEILALNAATRQDFSGGMYFLDCAQLTEQALILALTQCLGMTDEAADMDEVVARFATQPSLLTLANLDEPDLVATVINDLLLRCPSLKILMTARLPLHIAGERVVLVPSLAAENETQAVSLEASLQSPAIQLFCQRARAIQSEFRLTRTNAPAVIEICRRLDGLPLAIELAVARLDILSPLQLLDKLAGNDTPAVLELLRDGPADLPVRQSSLMTAFAWSYDLLGGEQQQLLKHLSLFTGGYALEDLEDLYRMRGVAVPPLVETMETLVQSSLVQVEATSENDEVRFWMLVTIREYGNTILSHSPEANAWHQAFAALYMQRREDQAPALVDRRQQQALRHIAQQLDNLRKALAVRLQHQQQRALSQHVGYEEAWQEGWCWEGEPFLQKLLQEYRINASE